jgi:DNA polymerase III subunit beta
MIFTADKAELISAIRNVSGAVDEKSKSVPALAFIKFVLENGVLSLTGYDLEIGITTSINVQSMDNGAFLCEKRIADLLSKLSSGDVEFSVEGEELTIKQGKSKNKRPVLLADDYPELPNADTSEPPFTLSQETLKNMIDETIFAVSVNENKPILTGELFDIEDGSFNLVAIDGFRLAIRNESIANVQHHFVVPAKSLKELSKLMTTGEVKVYKTRKHVTFDLGGIKVFSRLLEGEFHNYKGSLPSTSKTTAIINVRDAVSCLERCALIINEKLKAPVKLSFASGELNITCKTSAGEVDESIPIDFAGETLDIGFNCRFLLDAFKNCGTDTAKLSLGAPTAPATMTATSGNSFTFLVLPVRLKNN